MYRVCPEIFILPPTHGTTLDSDDKAHCEVYSGQTTHSGCQLWWLYGINTPWILRNALHRRALANAGPSPNIPTPANDYVIIAAAERKPRRSGQAHSILHDNQEHPKRGFWSTLWLPTVRIPPFAKSTPAAGRTPLRQRFLNCGPRTTSGPRVLPLWSF